MNKNNNVIRVRIINQLIEEIWGKNLLKKKDDQYQWSI